MPVEARLKREDADGNVVPYVVSEDSASPTGFADPIADYGARDKLTLLADRLDGDHTLGYVGDLMMVTATNGWLYIGGAGRIASNEATNIRGLLVNPADSTKLVYIVRVAIFSSAQGYMHFWRDPTVGLPTVAPTESNAYLGDVLPSEARIGFDASLSVPLSGGVDLKNTVGMAEGVRTAFDLPPLILPPGHSWGFSVPYSTPSDFTCSIYWVERVP